MPKYSTLKIIFISFACHAILLSFFTFKLSPPASTKPAFVFLGSILHRGDFAFGPPTAKNSSAANIIPENFNFIKSAPSAPKATISEKPLYRQPAAKITPKPAAYQPPKSTVKSQTPPSKAPEALLEPLKPLKPYENDLP